MKKKLLLSLLSVSLGVICAKAETHFDDPNNILYFENVKGPAGGQIKLSINLRNTEDITSYQTEIYLPEGITADYQVNDKGKIRIASFSQERGDAADFTFSSSFPEEGSYNRVNVLCYSTDGTTFYGNEGEVATLTLNVDPSVAVGDYTITYKNVVVSNNKDTYRQSNDLTSIVSIEEETLASGYDVVVAPFCLDNSGGGEQVADIYFNVAGDVTQASKIEFDLVLPKEWFDNFMISDVVKNSSLSTRYYTLADPIDNENGTYHFSLIAKSANYYFGKVPSTKIGSFKLYQDGGGDDESYAIEEGIYTISIKNIVATTSEGEVKPATYYTNVFVGNPTIKATDVLSGDYSSDEAYDILSAALPTADNTVTSINLTGVTALPANTTIALANPNALILTSKDLGLNNDQNVVIGDECAKFVITDGYPFNAPKSFTAADASYSRAMSNKYGTIVLPYAVESSATVQYYVLSDATVSGAEGTLIFTPVSSAAANQPALFQYTDGGEAEMVSMSAEVAATPSELIDILDGTDLQGSWAMLGSFEQQDVASPTVEGMTAYYIKNDTFWQANKSISVKPFRSYFLNGTTMQKTSYRIISDATGIDDITDQLNADDAVSYDLGGRQVETSEKNQVIVTNGSKTIIR